jgi:hypothetical protein
MRVSRDLDGPYDVRGQSGFSSRCVMSFRMLSALSDMSDK